MVTSALLFDYTVLSHSLLPIQQNGAHGPIAAGFGKSDSGGLGLQQGQDRRGGGKMGGTDSGREGGGVNRQREGGKAGGREDGRDGQWEGGRGSKQTEGGREGREGGKEAQINNEELRHHCHVVSTLPSTSLSPRMGAAISYTESSTTSFKLA